jgi:hypothetical protein
MASSDHFRDKTAVDEPRPSVLPNHLAGKRWPVKNGLDSPAFILLPMISSLRSATLLRFQGRARSADALVRFTLHNRLSRVGWQKDGWQKMGWILLPSFSCLTSGSSRSADALVRFPLHDRLSRVGWQKHGGQKMDHSPANDPSASFCHSLEIPRQDWQKNGGRRIGTVGVPPSSLIRFTHPPGFASLSLFASLRSPFGQPPAGYLRDATVRFARLILHPSSFILYHSSFAPPSGAQAAAAQPPPTGCHGPAAARSPATTPPRGLATLRMGRLAAVRKRLLPGSCGRGCVARPPILGVVAWVRHRAVNKY